MSPNWWEALDDAGVHQDLREGEVGLAVHGYQHLLPLVPHNDLGGQWQFFKDVFQSKLLSSLYAFDNKVYFNDVGLNQKLFVLMTLCGTLYHQNSADFAFYVSSTKELTEKNITFSMSSGVKML